MVRRRLTPEDGGDTHMPDSPPYSGTPEDSGSPLERPTPGMPRWVKVSLIVALVLAVLVVVVLLVGGGVGDHGPGRH
jgi:hypothetical protein